jgi:hypothetical protein
VLKWGMVAIGLGIGILIGHLVSPFFPWNPQAGYFSMIFICGGLSLIIYYLIERKQKNNEK